MIAGPIEPHCGAVVDRPFPIRVRAAVAAAAVAVHGCLLWLYWHPAPKVLWGDEVRYWQAAHRLLSGTPDWRPELLWPTLYSRFVAGVSGACGESLAAVQVAQTALLLASAVVLHDLVRRLAGSSVAAGTSAALVVLYPPIVAFAHFLWPEILHLFLFSAALWILVARRTGPGWAVGCGLALGLTLLAKSLLTAFVPVLLGAAVWPERRGAGSSPWPRRLAWAIVAAATAAATVTPTVLANARRAGVARVADSSLFNLWVGLNEQSRDDHVRPVVRQEYLRYLESGTSFREREQVLRAKISALVAERGPMAVLSAQLGRQYFRLLDRNSFLTDQLPGGPTIAGGKGYVHADPRLAGAVRGASHLTYLALLASAPFGLALWPYRDRRWVRVLLVFVLYNLGLFLLLHIKTRYRVQMLPVLFAGAGGAVAWVRAWIRDRNTLPPPSLVRVTTASVVAVLLLVLALAGPWLDAATTP
jgi:4-amino-4-deoxy-L-arabinose transferase-like glycosyltransferase